MATRCAPVSLPRTGAIEGLQYAAMCSSIRGHASSGSYLAIAIHDIFVAGQFSQPTRTPRVKLVGTDANLGPKTELVSVIESRAGIDHHGRAVDTCCKVPRRVQVVCDNRIGVMRSVLVNVIDCAVKRGHDLDGQDGPKVLGAIVRRGRQSGSRGSSCMFPCHRAVRPESDSVRRRSAAESMLRYRRGQQVIRTRYRLPSAGTSS